MHSLTVWILITCVFEALSEPLAQEGVNKNQGFLKFADHHESFTLDNLEKDIRSNNGFRNPNLQRPSDAEADADAFLPGLSSGGIYPGLAVTADSVPKRSECGIGALMPWADKLYMVSYLSVPDAGSGTGLYEISSNFTVGTGRPSTGPSTVHMLFCVLEVCEVYRYTSIKVFYRHTPWSLLNNISTSV